MKLSLIDFATIYQGERPRDSFQRSVALAQQAEAAGFSRVWYAEHHNMPTISSSAPRSAHLTRGGSHIYDPTRRRRRHAPQPLPLHHR